MSVLGVAAREVAGIVSAAVGFFREHAAIMLTLAAAIVTSVVAYQAYAAIVKIVNGVTIAYNTAVFLVTAATKGWTVAQVALDGALIANPIGVIITAIVLLVAAIVYIATRTTWFQDIWRVTWTWVKSVTAPVVDWFMSYVWPTMRTAFENIARIVEWAWENVIQPSLRLMVFYIQNVLVPVALWLWHNIFEPVMAGIGRAVQAMWIIVQITWQILKASILSLIVAPLQNMWSIVQPLWNLFADRVRTTWNTIKPYFDLIMDFIENRIVRSFRNGVNAIGVAWDILKAKVKEPVTAVVNTIINPLINGFNRVAGFFGVKDKVDTIAGFAEGGYTGAGSKNQPAGIVHAGEWVVPADKTRVFRPLLEAIQQGGVAGYADGGLVSAITNPGKFVASLIDGPLRSFTGRFGTAPFVQMLAEVPRRIASAVVSKIKSLLSFSGDGGPTGAGPGFLPWPASPGAQRGDSGVWHNVVDLIRSTGPLSGSFGNAYRPGDPLWHGSGRAVDWMGFNQDALAQFFMARMGSVLELIHSTNTRNYGVSRGRPSEMGAQLWSEHKNHIHIAMDTGYGVLQPGNNNVWNGTGHPEPIASAGGMDAVVARLDRLIRAVDRVAPGVGAELNGAGRGLTQLARAR
jgi:hypothetical protein